ncbi:MAG: hypothetical protein K8R69_00690 [Deltaproteobacteria bacterium]|nr:hypothetical protein [Deltaproteobacteria bacterium]
MTDIGRQHGKNQPANGYGKHPSRSTLLAFTSSLPELISSVSVTEARLGQSDLVIGNIIGSNAIKMVIFVLFIGSDQNSRSGNVPL